MSQMKPKMEAGNEDRRTDLLNVCDLINGTSKVMANREEEGQCAHCVPNVGSGSWVDRHSSNLK